MNRLFVCCPHCDRLLVLHPDEEDTRGQCPGCYGAIAVPAWNLLRRQRGKKLPPEAFTHFHCPQCQQELAAEFYLEHDSFCTQCKFPLPFRRPDRILLEGSQTEMIWEETDPLPPIAALGAELLRPNDPWRAGQILNGKYQVLETIGKGEMGNLYLIYHLLWNVPLVVKTPLPGLDEKQFRRRMQKWIYFGYHPNLVAAVAIEALFGRPRLFLEYVEGTDLASEIEKGPLDLLQLIDYAIQMCRGLAYIHRRGLLHRDLKPSNIIIEREEEGHGVVKVTDFGWMRQAGQGRERLEKVKDLENKMGMLGNGMGTPPYMSPEQFEDLTKIGPAADIYSFGVILYEMCTGQRPFQVPAAQRTREETWEQYRQLHLQAQPPKATEQRSCLPATLIDLIHWTMEKEPAKRPGSFEEIQGVLKAIYIDITQRPYDRDEVSEDQLIAINLNNRALGRLENGKLEEAGQLWQQALEADPSLFSAVYNLNLLRCRQREIDLPTFCRRLKQMRGADPLQSLLLRTMVCLERGGLIDESLEELKEAQRCSPEDQSLIALEGELLYRMGRYSESAAVLRQICQRGGETQATRWFRLGCSYLENDEKEKANWAWNMGLEREPNNPECWMGKGYLQILSRDHHKAEKTLEHALQAKPDMPWGLLQLSQVYYLRGDDTPQGQEYRQRARTLLERLWQQVPLPTIIELYAQRFQQQLPQRQNAPAISPWSHIQTQSFYGQQCCFVAPNGQYVIMRTGPDQITVWDLVKRKMHAQIKEAFGELYCTILSANGSVLVTGSAGNKIQVWNLAEAKCIATFRGFTGGVSCLATSASGRYVLSGTRSSGNLLWMWDSLTENRHATFEGHSKQVTCIYLSPDEEVAISGSWDHTVRVWHLADQRLMTALTGHTAVVTCVTATTDGTLVVSGSDDQTIRVWESATGKLRLTLAGHQGGITALVLTPDNQFVISGSDDQTMRVWDLATGSCLAILEGHDHPICSIGVTANGRGLISACNDETVRVWEDLSARKASWSVQANYLYHGILPRSHLGVHNRAKLWLERAHAALKHGKSEQALRDFWRVLELEGYHRNHEALEGIAQAGLRGRCQRRHLRQPWSLKTLPGHQDGITALTITADGKWALSGSADHSIRVWDLQEGESVATLQGHTDEISCLQIIPDGYFLLSGSKDKKLRVWDLSSYECCAILDGHTWDVQCLAVSHDGCAAVSGGADRTLVLWDLKKYQARTNLVWHTMSVDVVALTPDGSIAISGSADKTLRVWDLITGERCETLKGHDGPVTCLTITPDGACVISGSTDGTIRLWDIAEGSCRQVFEGHNAGISCLTVTPNGRFAISGSPDQTLRVWDLAAGRCRYVLGGHRGTINSVSLTPDGFFAVSASADASLKVWSLQTGECHATLHEARPVQTMALSANGRFVIAGYNDGTLHVWELEWQWDLSRGTPLTLGAT